ncbi:ABC transporter A family member 8 [Acorus gramineus]|uniref:ABC transporter A family member 8 n=1 Tax=Acorus gramineus TaxID=55184 RepID=A0AAV9ALM8_ACOGR|nr:ABC transporter A family member 8 [Acorus gramineus]
MASHISHSSSSSNSRDTHIASLLTQADALLRKNLAYQRRDIKQNASLVLFPAFLCLLIISIQHIVNSELDNSKYQCGCKCVSPNGTNDCHNICGFEFSTSKQAPACQIRRPREWPALLQVPGPQYRAVKTRKHHFQNLPDSDCLKTLSCPLTTLYTAENKSTAEGLVRTIIASTFPVTKEDLSDIVSLSYLGTNSRPGSNNFAESAFVTVSPILILLPLCFVNFSFLVPVTLGSATFQHEIKCVESTYVWRDNSSNINRELFQGYRKGNPYNEIHEILGAFDFLNSGEGNLNVSLWYNSTYRNVAHSPRLLRVTRSLNMVSNAFLRHFKDRDARIILDFVKEMPKSGNRIAINLSTILGPLLFSWVIQLLFPVFLISLVYEKQHMLRIMMKIHGLSDRAYWMVTYTYFLAVSSLYMIWFAAIGSTIGKIHIKHVFLEMI